MPLVFLLPLLLVLMAYFLHKKFHQRPGKKCLALGLCTFVWASMVYQFISLASYIDESGQQIERVLGPYGLGLAWISLILFSVYLAYLYVDFFTPKTKK
ncbi:MAG: hypothetical protein Q4E37_04170 [Tissierellia bacterium]|nr:hypothetical protein [Tissierellia bacterium]